MIIELALRELLRRHLGTLPADKQRQIEQAIQTATKGSRASGLADLTLGQLIGVIRDTAFFDAWTAATGQPLAALRLIDLNALTRFRNKALTHLGDWGQATDPAAQVSPADAQFLLHCLDLIITAFGILSLEDTSPTPDPALLARLPPLAASPYLGLRAFGAEQRDLFFGREHDTDQLLARVQSQPFVALVGNSGSGKSSLVAAGLLPRLPAEDWLTLSLQPRDDLIDRLAAALLPHLYPDPAEQAGHRADLSARLAAPDYRLDHLLESLPDRGTRRVLLVVDQFEELFTLCADRQRQRRAVDLLLSALHATLHTDPAGPLRLLLVLRADFYGHLLDLAPLQQALDRWPPFNLGPMGPAALQDAIVKPAERAGLTLESGLAATIVRDLGDEPGHLPLLQTALDELWQRSDRHCLTHAGYRAIGGLSQALARKADDFLAGYNAAGHEQVRRIFVQLVRPGEGAEDTRQLATRAQVGADNWGLVTLLATERLLVTGHDLAGHETVQLAHEALIRHWQQLRDWINEDRGFRLWQNKLRDSRADWVSHGQDEGYLLRGLRLAEAREQLAERDDWLDGEERDYIAAGTAAQERERAEREAAALARRRAERRILYGLAIGLAGALSLAGYAFWQRTRAEQASRVATLARGQAEDLIYYMLFDLRDKLQPIGQLELLDGVSRQVAAYFEQLLADRGAEILRGGSGDRRAAGPAGPGECRVATGPLDQPREDRRDSPGSGRPGWGAGVLRDEAGDRRAAGLAVPGQCTVATGPLGKPQPDRRSAPSPGRPGRCAGVLRSESGDRRAAGPTGPGKLRVATGPLDQPRADRRDSPGPGRPGRGAGVLRSESDDPRNADPAGRGECPVATGPRGQPQQDRRRAPGPGRPSRSARFVRGGSGDRRAAGPARPGECPVADGPVDQPHADRCDSPSTGRLGRGAGVLRGGSVDPRAVGPAGPDECRVATGPRGQPRADR